MPELACRVWHELGSKKVCQVRAHASVGCTPRGSCNRTQLSEGFLEGSLKEVLLRRVFRRRLVRVSIETGVLRMVLRRGCIIEGA